MFQKIPQELKDLKQWVCNWDGSKVPMRADRREGAKVGDPSTWCSYEQAEYCVREGYYDYLGFVFRAGGGIVGIDIDAGFNGRLLSPLASDIILRCKSYTEKSKSGRGVHIILRGHLPWPGKNNHKGVEIYQSGRYFVTTGKQILYKDIIENQAAIDYVVGKYFKEEDRGCGSIFRKQVIYRPEWKLPTEKIFFLKPAYPQVQPGSRNLCLTSLAGQLHSIGYNDKQIYDELLTANKEACDPPIDEREVEQIVCSVTRYRR